MPWDVYERSQGYHDLVFALALRESELNKSKTPAKSRGRKVRTVSRGGGVSE
jgi:hypothetical protein